ncbi:polymeric immunoglobulin receptor-like, partial [Clarias magur]
PLDCSDMIGFSGGSIIMISDIQWDPMHTKYICKMGQSGCNDVIRFHSQSNHVQYKRFLLYKNTGGSFLVLIRRLKPQDAGTYIFGVEDQSNYTVNLKVRNDASCGVSKIMSTNLGQNITITCNYPGEYEKNNKYVITMNDEFNVKPIIDTRTTSEDSRFSISDDKGASILSLNISNVSEADDLFYLFGVWSSVGSLGYYTYFTEIQLHVTGTYLTTSAPREIQSGAVYSCSSAIISVCVGEALLLIGAFALIIYKLSHKRTCGST